MKPINYKIIQYLNLLKIERVQILKPKTLYNRHRLNSAKTDEVDNHNPKIREWSIFL